MPDLGVRLTTGAVESAPRRVKRLVIKPSTLQSKMTKLGNAAERPAPLRERTLVIYYKTRPEPATGKDTRATVGMRNTGVRFDR